MADEAVVPGPTAPELLAAAERLRGEAQELLARADTLERDAARLGAAPVSKRAPVKKARQAPAAGAGVAGKAAAKKAVAKAVTKTTKAVAAKKAVTVAGPAVRRRAAPPILWNARTTASGAPPSGSSQALRPSVPH